MTLTTNSNSWRGPGKPALVQTPIIIPMLDIAQPTIPFERLPVLDGRLTFMPRPPPSSSSLSSSSSSLMLSRKRGRAAADIDGEHSCLHKKKRRLRLFLITSRLSPQFSHPATNIVDRGRCKIAVWAKQKAAAGPGRNLLPKAAMLNRMRRGAVAARDAVSRRRLLVEQEREQRQLELARLTFNYGAIHTYTRPVHSPTEPLPLATANRHGNHHLSSSPLSSPTTSRSPSPSASPPPTTTGPVYAAPSSQYKSPNAAYALSPPRSQSSPRTYEPHLPSPLGLSNYDAFDSEDLGAKDQPALDRYSHLDDDDDDDEEDENDRFSFFWDNDDNDNDDDGQDFRHDSPFAASVATADSAWPSPMLNTTRGCDEATTPAKAKKAIPKTLTYGGALDPHFAPVAPVGVGPLAVQYPGAPVPSEEVSPVVVSPVVKRELVPACMSPNFLAADEGGWGKGK